MISIKCRGSGCSAAVAAALPADGHGLCQRVAHVGLLQCVAHGGLLQREAHVGLLEREEYVGLPILYGVLLQGQF